MFMGTKFLQCIEMETSESAPITHSVIWLHGLGASGDDFVPVVPELQVPTDLGVRFIFPHAPVRPITINGGMEMRGWYDITSLDFSERKQDVAGTLASSKAIEQLMEREIERGTAAENIILAGFSQGGAIALYTALTSRYRVGGVLALSTYLPLSDEVFNTMQARPEAQDERTSLPIFMAHGSHDEVILLQYAEASKTSLTAAGFTVEWSTWPMPHSVIPEEIAAMARWFKTQWRK